MYNFGYKLAAFILRNCIIYLVLLILYGNDFVIVRESGCDYIPLFSATISAATPLRFGWRIGITNPYRDVCKWGVSLLLLKAVSRNSMPYGSKYPMGRIINIIEASRYQHCTSRLIVDRPCSSDNMFPVDKIKFRRFLTFNSFSFPLQKNL